MPHRDMRDFLAVLEQKGKLHRIRKTVDRLWEPASLAKWMYQALPADRRLGLFFENVAGSAFPLVTGALGASPETYCIALGCEPDELNKIWLAALTKPVAPKLIERGVSQEVVLTGKDADLNRLPIPVWTPGKDVAPYITTMVFTRHADTGVQNIGVYRTQVKDAHTVICNLGNGRQGTMYARSHTERGKPAPIAWVIGAEPVVHLASVANLPPNADEITVAGGLKGAPIEMVKCKTIDMLVPATAEIVIEGEVIPGAMEQEGPFGEFAGFMGPVNPRPVIRITAITHRKGAIFYGYTSQMPPSESTVLQSLSNGPVILKQLRHDLGELTVSDCHIDLTFGGMLAHVVVAMKPMTPGHAKHVGRMTAEISPLKRVTVVDDDIDIRDPVHLDWAMNARYDPARDTIIIPDVFVPQSMDPSVRVRGGVSDLGSKIVIDATQSIDSGDLSLPKWDVMNRALETWKSEGLPEFTIPKRVRYRLDRA
ncbi:MAG: UbiD family decarboxylase [Alphaproteobacteria bacterium]|nr:UbiD family decarboxylase [Alphaproteobacteria bacterium]